MLSSHLRKPVRSNANLKPDEWCKHLADLRALGVLASQATEYVYNKNKTEGKSSGVMKPDLIPLEKRSADDVKKSAETLHKRLSTESPKKQQVDLKKSDNLEKATKELSIKTSPEKTKVSQDTEKFIKNEQSATTSSPKSTTPNTSNIANQSPNKNKAKPTEIKKPGAIDTGRFKAAKVAETLSSSSEAAKKASELEKIAAAKLAERSKSKSPTSRVIEKTEPKPEIKPSASKANDTQTSLLAKSTIVTTTAPTPTTSSTPKPSLTNNAKSASTASTSAVKDNAKRPSLRRHKDSLTECKPLNVLVYAETSTARESAVNTLKEVLADNT